MKLFIPKDYFNNPKPPRLFLCSTGKKILGELQAYDVNLDAKWASYSELTFTIDRQYTDILTGETITDPLFDRAEALRKVYAENIGYFIIQDPESEYGEKDSKTLTAFSTEYETVSKYLEEFYINTGEVDSAEIIYHRKHNGENYSTDSLYTRATEYDSSEKYFIKILYGTTYQYHKWEQIEIVDEDAFNQHQQSDVDPLYIRTYKNVRFYWEDPKYSDLSLLHLIFKKIPEWEIGHVDTDLKNKERKFDEERVAVYDFLMEDVQDAFSCVIEWDTVEGKVNFYAEAEDDGINEDGTIQTRFETDVFVSRENLASQIDVKYSADDIKTKLKVAGSDGLDIREVNLGRNHIINLDYFHTVDWMEQDLYDAYQIYLDRIEEYTEPYTKAVQGWVDAYGKWNDLTNAIPIEGNVVRVGDEFKKLYCIYSPIDTAYLPDTIFYTDDEIKNGVIINTLYRDDRCTIPIDKLTLSDGDTFIVQGYSFVYKSSSKQYKCTDNKIKVNIKELEKKLKLYHVDKDTQANETDNILLKLINNNSDSATIRIFFSITEGYSIERTIVYADGKLESPKTYTIDQWISGDLTAKTMELSDFSVQYIGTMGAYLVLTKDERDPDNLEDYGIKLLQEKHDTYTQIFQAQIEAMFSNANYQCSVGDEPPTGDIPINTRWLDTNSVPITLNEFDGQTWNKISATIPENEQAAYENYQRYIDNYNKLKAVQEILVTKEKEATYWLDGFAINDRYILYNKASEEILHSVAQHYFGNKVTIIRVEYDSELPLYTFKVNNTSYAIYLKNGTPYVSYANSRGVYQTIMDKLSSETELENFFNENQWIRLSPFIREDEFNDDNFFLTGYESEEEKLKIMQELMKMANKELETLSQPSLEFSMDMGNILALPEFKPLINQFQLGNFIKVGIRDDYVKRARLLEIHMSFDDLSDFSADFGNLITTKSEIDKHAELLAQAVSAGKQVASSASEWQMAVDKSNKIEEDIMAGLADATLSIGNTSGQSIVWDQYGIWGRKLIDGTTDQYEDEQFRMINNKLVFSRDGFKTSKSVFGKFTYDGVEYWGVLADAAIAAHIEGSNIVGGTIQIGEQSDGTYAFEVKEDGTVTMGGGSKVGSSTVEDIDNLVNKKNEINNFVSSHMYRVEVTADGPTIITNSDQETILTCKVYSWDSDITETISDGDFSWVRHSQDTSDDDLWNSLHIIESNTISIRKEDMPQNGSSATFSCQVELP